MSERDAFVQGYTTALHEIEGYLGLRRFGLLTRDPVAAALRAYREPGWVEREMREAIAEEEAAPQAPRETRAPRLGTIYVIGTAERDLVKIGWTASDVAQRWKALENARGEELHLLLTLPGTQRDEVKLHQRFADDRMPRGEWFRMSIEISEWIQGVNE
jgi:hypothetical protein